MTNPRLTLSAFACALASVFSSGCLSRIMLNKQVSATRTASAAVDTLSDYEVANTIAFAGLAQFEGFHYLGPDNEDALFLLTKGWAATSFAFIEDAMEEAEDRDGPDSPAAEYQRARARAAYDRSIHYGIELLELKHAGFDAARRNADTMKAWLKGFDTEDAPNLFWTGYAWMSKTNVAKEDPAVVADLFVGVEMMERAVALNENYLAASGHTVLGAYHARTALAELDESKTHFERSLQLSSAKLLMTKFQYAAKYFCMRADKASYVQTLTEVVDAGDVWPEQRLSNTIAKRRAKRYLGSERMKNCGFAQ